MNRMKLVALLALVPGLAFAQIANTRHDMASGATGSGPKSTSTTQTCIFCHTPHSAAAQSLLWNHKASTATRGWTAVSTQTGTSLPSALTARSMVCLACHDNSVGLGEVNNVGGGSSGTITIAAMNSGYFVGTSVASTGTMTSNHPVSIPYAGATYNGITSRTTTTGTMNYQATATSSCVNSSGFCVSGSGGTVINLYMEGTDSTALGVECGSCHEPHNKYGFSFFLRVTPNQSALCLTCHEK